MSKKTISKWEKSLVDVGVRRFMEMNPTLRAVAILRLSVYQKTQFAALLDWIIKEGIVIEREQEKEKEILEAEMQAAKERRKRVKT